MSERVHMDMPSLVVEIDGLGSATLVASGDGYYVHSGDQPREGERPVWTINGVTYAGSVHVEQPEPGKTWIVPWPILSHYPDHNKRVTDAAHKKFAAVLRPFLERHAQTPTGATHLRAGRAAAANNDVVRLAERLAGIHDHHKNVIAAHKLAEARCAALDAGRPDPGMVDSPDTPRGL